MTDELKQEMTEKFNSAYGEEVVIGLREALRKVYIDGGEYGYQYALQHPHWIPVEEELPKKDGKYLFYDEVLGHEVSIYYDGVTLVSSITHWMPMPEAPRKEGDND